MTVTTPATEAAGSVPRLPEELVASTTFLLKRLGFAAKDRGMSTYEEVGLHPSHFAILVVLDEGSRETQGSIADALGYDRGQLVGLLDDLEERTLVERKRDPKDRRRHLVRLTPDGKQALRRLRSLARKNEEDFLAPLSATEREKLHSLLLRLAEKHEPGCAAVGKARAADART